MSENLYVRVRRLVSANVNDLVDTLEKAQAEAVMKEAIREVDRAAEEVRAELGKAIAKQHHIRRTIEMTAKKIADLRDKAVFAVKQGRDDLAEAAVARMVDLEAQIPVLSAAAEEARAGQLKLEEFVAALGGRKRDMEADLKAFEEARRIAESAMGTISSMPEQRAGRAQQAFDRTMKSASGLNAAKPAPGNASQLAELEQMSRAQAIAGRLADLKKSA